MSDQEHPSADQRLVERDAAQWLARRDRGLSPAEQDEYLQWLRLDPRHGEAFGRHEATLRRMMRLGDWQPALCDDPNPDLFAPRRRLRWQWLAASCGAAAALVVGTILWWPDSAAESPVPRTSYLRVNERQALPDGSLVELKDGSHIAVEFSATERRVRLAGGEAHFTVAKNPARPFVVVTGSVAVRAVGTAFNVRLDATTVDVLVTEGRVMVEKRDPVRHDTTHTGKNADHASDGRQTGETPSGLSSASPVHASEVPLVAGQRALVALAATSREMQVTHVGPQEIMDMLAWQSPRLQFFETPLAVAIAQFNHRSDGRPHSRLVLDNPDLGALPIGGTFRVDNVEGFVRLLEVTLDLRAEPRGENELVLKRAHPTRGGRQ